MQCPRNVVSEGIAEVPRQRAFQSRVDFYIDKLEELFDVDVAAAWNVPFD